MNARTARKDRSIWHPIKENAFRERLIDLSQKSNQVPCGPLDRQIPRGDLEDKLFAFEVTLAKAFAFIAAANEGVESVSAACIENVQGTRSLIVRIASNSGVRNEVEQHLQAILTQLARFICADGRPDEIRLNVLREVLTLNETRIHARLKSIKWQKPHYFRGDRSAGLPLWHNLLAICEDIDQNHAAVIPNKFAAGLRKLVNSMKVLDELSPDEEEDVIITLQQIVQGCHELCSTNKRLSFENTLARNGLLHLLRNKHIRQLEKIAGYVEITDFIVLSARKYPEKFRDAKIACVPQFGATRSWISSKGSSTSCHVHAEVQLICFYELHSSTLDHLPRVIGTSKAACFLCAQFIRLYGRYMIETAHRRIYEQWTLPDLAEYSDEQISRYRIIIAQMYEEIDQLSRQQYASRQFPLTSWLDLNGKPPFSGPPSSKTTSAFSIPCRSVGKQNVSETEALLQNDSILPSNRVENAPDRQTNSRSAKISSKSSLSGPPSNKTNSLSPVLCDQAGQKNNYPTEVLQRKHVVLPPSQIGISPDRQSDASAAGISDRERTTSTFEECYDFKNEKLSIEIFGSVEAGLQMKLIAIEDLVSSVKVDGTSQKVELDDMELGQEIQIEQDWEDGSDSLEVAVLSKKQRDDSCSNWRLVLQKCVGSVTKETSDLPAGTNQPRSASSR